MGLDIKLYKWNDKDRLNVFATNITHNLGEMAMAVGLYDCIWRPDENGYSRAAEIAGLLSLGFIMLEQNPDKYSAFDSPNGWGVYKDFVSFIEEYRDACFANPEAFIEVDR